MVRNKYITGALMAGFLAVLLLTVRREGIYRGPGAPEILEPVGTATEPPPPEPTYAGIIGKNASFFDLMSKCGLPPREIDRIARITRSVYDFRRVFPGQCYEFYADSAGALKTFKLVIDDESYVEVMKRGDDITAERKDYHFDVTVRAASGVIESSLYAAILAQKLPVELGAMLSDVFAWDVDFFTELRANDFFRVLYEEKRRPAEGGRDEIVKIGSIISAELNTSGESHYAFRFETGTGGFDYFDEEGKSLRKQLLKAPLSYTRISSNFSSRRMHPVLHHYAPHYGTDYAAPTGTPVMSTGDGTVLVAGYHRGNGNYVKIRHNSNYVTYYLHFSRFAKGIRAGAKVKQGQVIGYVGSTGYATGPHLDYRIMKDGRFVNPRTIKLPPASPVSEADMARFSAERDSLIAELQRISIDGAAAPQLADGGASTTEKDREERGRSASHPSAAH